MDDSHNESGLGGVGQLLGDVQQSQSWGIWFNSLDKFIFGGFVFLTEIKAFVVCAKY